MRRIINVPKRGIGLTTVDRIQEYAIGRGISFLDSAYEVENIAGMSRAVGKIQDFTNLIDDFREQANRMSVSELFSYIIEQTGYVDELAAEKTEEAEGRIENIDELLNKIVSYEESAEEPTLNELLEEIALVADIDNLENDTEAVVIMTLHSAKGLEFPYVFMGGMEDGMFPSYMTIVADDQDELEEERRLCYVGITRAKKQLFLSAARKRMIRGQTQFNKVSRFINEIPRELLEITNGMSRFQRGGLSSLAEDHMKKAFQSRTPVMGGNPYKKQEVISPKVSLDYGVGDTVKHLKFGVGVVTEIRSGGKDYEVTVDFEKVGVKKMFASFAKLKKISE